MNWPFQCEYSFLFAFSVTCTFRLRFTCKKAANDLTKQQEPNDRNNRNCQLENDTRVSKCLSLAAVFSVATTVEPPPPPQPLSVPYLTKSGNKWKKSRWTEWLIIATCLICRLPEHTRNWNGFFVCVCVSSIWFFPDPFKFKSIKTLITHFALHIKSVSHTQTLSFTADLLSRGYLVSNLAQNIKFFTTHVNTRTRG